MFFCAGAADGALIPFFPLWASHDAHIPVALIGLLFACYAGGEILAARRSAAWRTGSVAVPSSWAELSASAAASATGRA